MTLRSPPTATFALALGALASAPLMAADWPMWGGPAGDWIGDATPIVADLALAKPLWRARPDIPGGRGQDLRYGCPVPPQMPAGGCASPIVWGGLVIQYFYRPAGRVFDASIVEKMLAKDEAAADGGKRSPVDPAFVQRFWTIGAEDVIVAVDAATGEQRWEAVIPGGLYHVSHAKPRGGNNTPCVVDGTLCVMSSVGVLHGLDAATGKARWSTPGPQHEGLARKRDASLKNGTFVERGYGYSFPALVGGDGIVAASLPGGRSGNRALYGYRVADGAAAWNVAGVNSDVAVPARWRGPAGLVFLCGTREGTVTAIAAADGAVLWKLEGLGSNATDLLVHGDLLIVREGTERTEYADTTLAAYRLGKDRPVKLWPNDPAQAIATQNASRGLLIKDGVLYARCLAGADGGGLRGNGLRAIDAATGAPIGLTQITWDGAGGSVKANWTVNGTIQWAGGQLVVGHDLNHDFKSTWGMYGTGKALGLLGAVWTPPHDRAVAYEIPLMSPVVDGILYFRSDSGLLAYDLRPGAVAKTSFDDMGGDRRQRPKAAGGKDGDGGAP